MEGERYVLAVDGIVLRVSMVYEHNYSGRKITFLHMVKDAVSSRRVVKIASDQFMTPTYVLDIPVAIHALLENDATGIFHLGTIQRTSRFDFALNVSKLLGLDSSYIQPISMNEDPFYSDKPRDTSFNLQKISKYIHLRTIEQTLSVD